MTIKNNESMTLDQLTGKLKNEDSRYAKISKGFTIVYLILLPIYVVLSIVEYRETRDMLELYSGGATILSFITFLFLFKSFHKEYNSVDYSEPTLKMLKAAAHRYKPFTKKTLWALVALAFVNVSFILDFNDEGLPVWINQLIFIGIFSMAIGMGLLFWYIRYRPLRLNALKLIKELEAE